ncbi:MAG: hypothetical protein FWG66_01350 [Spirochaetes bacterium]|nr:hypothetical protein [Spirochaetota bacterium]
MKKVIGLFALLSIFIVSDAFSRPFGIGFGMTLEQISQISRTTPLNVTNDWYAITPPNTHELFEIYMVRIHPVFGVYFIRAVSRNISTSGHGTELIGLFDNLVSNIERIYGDYYKVDRLNPEERIFTGSQHFMFTLSQGSRELAVVWHREIGSRLPEDISEIIIFAGARNSSNGSIIIEYYSINYDAIEEERFSVF